MGNPNSKEVHKLRSIYESELEEFWKIYEASKEQLKMVLEQLCSKNLQDFTE